MAGNSQIESLTVWPSQVLFAHLKNGNSVFMD